MNKLLISPCMRMRMKRCICTLVICKSEAKIRMNDYTGECDGIRQSLFLRTPECVDIPETRTDTGPERNPKELHG